MASIQTGLFLNQFVVECVSAWESLLAAVGTVVIERTPREEVTVYVCVYVFKVLSQRKVNRH